MTPAETKRSPISLPTVLIGLLFVVAVVAALFFMNRSTSASNKLKSKDKKIDSLNTEFKSMMDSLNTTNDQLKEKVEGLTKQKDRLAATRDSVLRLLNYALANDRNSKGKIAQLEKKLKDVQGELSKLQKSYDDILASAGNSGAEYKQRLEALTQERDAIAKENLELKKQLSEIKKDVVEGALFSKTMAAVPGELSGGKFSASTRSQNTDRVEVKFTLSRAPKADEQLLFRIYDPTNKEVALNPSYRKELSAPANPINQKVQLVFEKKLDRKNSGRFSVRLFLTSNEKGIANQEIGTGNFEVK
jgi:uncharacterized phage infection (PIP) family protein YhgE